MFKKFNNNPSGANIDDCFIRATSLAVGIPYYDMMDELIENADNKNFKENSLLNLLDVLAPKGWTLYKIEERKTVKQMAEMLGDGKYLIVTTNHITCSVDGDVYDTWNCNRYKALYYFIKED